MMLTLSQRIKEQKQRNQSKQLDIKIVNQMKTKHKLKLLKELRIKISSTIAISNKVPNVSSEYNRILDELIAESKEPTQKPEIEAKPEPITETFEVGDQVEIIDDKAYHGIPIGFKFEICKITDMKTGVKHLYSGNLLFIPFEDIKKIPTQKDNPKEFKVGDKVKIVEGKNGPFYHFKDGEKVVICALHNDSKHGLCAYCNNGHTTNQWVSIKELEHI